MNKISTSGSAIKKLLVLFLIIWIIIHMIVDSLFNGFYPKQVTIIVLIVFIALIKSITGSVKMNQAIILLDTFSKKSRALFHGFFFKLPWEKISYLIDLEVVIESGGPIWEKFPGIEEIIYFDGKSMSAIPARKSGPVQIKSADPNNPHMWVKIYMIE